MAVRRRPGEARRSLVQFSCSRHIFNHPAVTDKRAVGGHHADVRVETVACDQAAAAHTAISPVLDTMPSCSLRQSAHTGMTHGACTCWPLMVNICSDGAMVTATGTSSMGVLLVMAVSVHGQHLSPARSASCLSA